MNHLQLINPIVVRLDGAIDLTAAAPVANGAASRPTPALGAPAQTRRRPLRLPLLQPNHNLTVNPARLRLRPAAGAGAGLGADGAADLAAAAPAADGAASRPTPALGAPAQTRRRLFCMPFYYIIEIRIMLNLSFIFGILFVSMDPDLSFFFPALFVSANLRPSICWACNKRLFVEPAIFHRLRVANDEIRMFSTRFSRHLGK